MRSSRLCRAARSALPATADDAPASGWVGSRLLSLNTDDWEPAVATDPKAPWVYLLTTRYGVVPPGCTSHCPSPFIALAISSDGGSSFGSQVAALPLPRR